MRQKLYVLLALFLLFGCKTECGECFTPPLPLLFEIIDKSTGENLFTNGTFSQEQIAVINSSANSAVEFDFIAENNLNLIQINSIGWQSESRDILVKINNENVFSLYVEAERVSENCCSFTRYNAIEIGV